MNYATINEQLFIGILDSAIIHAICWNKNLLNVRLLCYDSGLDKKYW